MTATQQVDGLSDSVLVTLPGAGVSYGLASTLEIKRGLETHLAEFFSAILSLKTTRTC